MTISTPQKTKTLKAKVRRKIIEHPYCVGCFDPSEHVIKGSNCYKDIEEIIKEKIETLETYLKLKDLSVDEVWMGVMKENKFIYKLLDQQELNKLNQRPDTLIDDFFKCCNDYLKLRIKKENTEILTRLSHHPEFEDSLCVPRNKLWKKYYEKSSSQEKANGQVKPLKPPYLIVDTGKVSLMLKGMVSEHYKGYGGFWSSRPGILQLFTKLFLKDREIIEKKLQIAEEEGLIEDSSTSRSNRKYEYKEKYIEKCEAGLPTEESVRGCFIYKKNVVHILIDENKKTKSRILTESDLKNLGTYANKEGKVRYENIENFIRFYILKIPAESIKFHSIKYKNKDDEIANYPKDIYPKDIEGFEKKADYPKLSLGTKLSWRHPDEKEMFEEMDKLVEIQDKTLPTAPDTDYKHKLEERKNDVLKIAPEIPQDCINYLHNNRKKSMNKIRDRRYKECEKIFLKAALKHPELKDFSDLEDIDDWRFK